MAARLRKLGRYTFIDVVCARLNGRSIRVFSACASLIIVLFYLVAQMVGAGHHRNPVRDRLPVCGPARRLLMILYLTFGGMIATTWVQIVKAVLMISGCVLRCILVLRQTGFSYSALLADSVAVHKAGHGILAPTSFAKSPLSAFSLGIAPMLGTAGLPHVLMRFFTVPDAKTARNSVLRDTILMKCSTR